MVGLEIIWQDGRPPAAVDGAWPRHPFDPLSADEIRGSVDLLAPLHRLDERTRFLAAHVQEPPVDTVLAVAGVCVMPREASPSCCPSTARASRAASRTCSLRSSQVPED